MPSSIYVIVRRPLSLKYLISGLSSLVKINGLEVSPKGNTMKQKCFVTPVGWINIHVVISGL